MIADGLTLKLGKEWENFVLTVKMEKDRLEWAINHLKDDFRH